MSNMDSKRRGLGMGLSALLGDDQTADAAPARRGVRTVPIGQVHPGKYQPRHVFDAEKLSSLVDSIREKGIIQPLLVRVDPDRPGEYELIAGERRWRAAQQAQLHDVPIVIRDLTDQDALEIALIENLQREDLNPIDEADAYRRLMDEFGHGPEEVARAVGKSRSHVANMIRLLGATPKIASLLSSGALTAGHARALLGADRADELADEIVARGLSVRQAEALAVKPKRRDPPAPTRDADIVALEQELTGALGLAVHLKPQGRGGSLVIEYRTLDQLDSVLKRLR